MPNQPAICMVIKIYDPNDPRILYYRGLKDKQLAARDGLFIVEGEHLVRRLLNSELMPQSILITHARYRTKEWDVPSSVPIYLAPKELVSKIVGFDFHRGS